MAPNNCDLCSGICGTGSACVCQKCASKIMEVQPNSAQQLKPEMPSELKMLTDLGWEKLDRNSNQVAHVAHIVYMYIARHIGR